MFGQSSLAAHGLTASGQLACIVYGVLGPTLGFHHHFPSTLKVVMQSTCSIDQCLPMLIMTVPLA
jgi:hypothetical protein